MPALPDPRRYSSLSRDDALARLVQQTAAGDTAARRALLLWARERLEGARDGEIRDALRRMPSAAAASGLWDAVCRAVEDDEAASEHEVGVRLFAFPIVLVVAGRQPAVVTGTLAHPDAIREALEKHGALGAARNVGLSNALCARTALDAIEPSAVLRWSREWSGPPRELAPQEIRVERGREQVHVRFIVGAGISPRDAPSIVETASNIGAWGIPLAKLLMQELACPAVDLLALPRPPVGLLRAPLAGRQAEIEAAFHLFVSNTLRELRAAAGEPTAIVSAHEGAAGAEVRVSMSSVFDAALLEGFRWPLHPFDDLQRIEAVIAELLQACRVDDLRVIPKVLPERMGSGRLFLRGGDAETGDRAH